MKKVFLMALLATLFSVGANAQGLEWGFKGGANIIWQTGVENEADLVWSDTQPITPEMEETLVRTKMRTGFYAGLFLEKVFNDRVGLQSELLLSQMGGRFISENRTFNLKLTYVAVPVLVNLYMSKKFSVDLGPQFGYLLFSDDGGGGTADLGYMSADICFIAGLTYRFANSFDVSARANLGLVNIDSDNAYNRAISIGMGYRF